MEEDSAVLRAVLDAVDAQPPLAEAATNEAPAEPQGTVAAQASGRPGVRSGIGVGRGTLLMPGVGSFNKVRALLAPRPATERVRQVGDAWEVTGETLQQAAAAARDSLGAVRVEGGYTYRTFLGRSRYVLRVKLPEKDNTPHIAAVPPVQVLWSRTVLRSLGVPSVTLNHLPLDDPETFQEWERTMVRAIERTLANSAPPDSDVVLVSRGPRGAAACLRAAAAGLPPGHLIVNGEGGPATPLRVLDALRQGMPPAAEETFRETPRAAQEGLREPAAVHRSAPAPVARELTREASQGVRDSLPGLDTHGGGSIAQAAAQMFATQPEAALQPLEAGLGGGHEPDDTPAGELLGKEEAGAHKSSPREEGETSVVRRKAASGRSSTRRAGGSRRTGQEGATGSPRPTEAPLEESVKVAVSGAETKRQGHGAGKELSPEPDGIADGPPAPVGTRKRRRPSPAAGEVTDG